MIGCIGEDIDIVVVGNSDTLGMVDIPR